MTRTHLECVSNLVDDGSDGRHVSISGTDLGSRGHFALHLQVIRDLGHNMASGSGQRLIFGLGFGSGLKRIVGEAQVRRTAIVGSGFARLTRTKTWELKTCIEGSMMKCPSMFTGKFPQLRAFNRLGSSFVQNDQTRLI